GAAVDLYFKIQISRIDAAGAFGDEQVGQDQSRALILVHQVKQFWNQFESVCLACRRNDDAWKIPRSRTENLPKIALLSLCWNASRRAATLHVHADNWRFDHTCHANAFSHQRETAPGSGAHGTATRMRGADDHINHSNFVLHLANHDAELAGMGRHPH